MNNIKYTRSIVGITRGDDFYIIINNEENLSYEYFSVSFFHTVGLYNEYFIIPIIFKNGEFIPIYSNDSIMFSHKCTNNYDLILKDKLDESIALHKSKLRHIYLNENLIFKPKN